MISPGIAFYSKPWDSIYQRLSFFYAQGIGGLLMGAYSILSVRGLGWTYIDRPWITFNNILCARDYPMRRPGIAFYSKV